jgi:hypothetical protein
MKLKTNAIITKYDIGILFIQFPITRVLFSKFFHLSIHAISDKKQLFYELSYHPAYDTGPENLSSVAGKITDPYLDGLEDTFHRTICHVLKT